MSGKARTWWAVAGVAVLAGIWWASGGLSPRTQQRTFRERIMRVDTGALSSFLIRPAPRRGHPEMRFERDGGHWTLRSAGFHTPADQRRMDELLALISDVRTLRVIGRLTDVKAAYGLTDSTADHLVLDTPEGRMDLAVGVMSSGDEPATAVHASGDEAVYAVPGMLGLYTSRSYIDWIPKPMVNGDPARWKRVTFVFPNDQGYSLERHGAAWTLNGLPTDSLKVARYLRNLSRYSGSALTDPADTLKAVLVYNLVVEDSTRAAPIMLRIFQAGDRLIARSTLAPPEIVMPFDPQVEIPRLFRPPSAFLPDGQPPVMPAVNR
ncbi:MAG: DUF4340 domain-containing protein [Bacteroidetes bacterium]|nr:DUF4340 domain-containing protein [Bacteroidota bacterium]